MTRITKVLIGTAMSLTLVLALTAGAASAKVDVKVCSSPPGGGVPVSCQTLAELPSNDLTDSAAISLAREVQSLGYACGNLAGPSPTGICGGKFQGGYIGVPPVVVFGSANQAPATSFGVGLGTLESGQASVVVSTSP